MAGSQVPRRPSCPSKAFKNVSRGASLDTTAGSGSVQHSSGNPPDLDTSSTFIVADWDDTLFPSTEIFDRWGLDLWGRADKLDDEQVRLLGIWRRSLHRFVRAMSEFSHRCAIVTNAQTRWVEDCLERFAPEVLHVMSEHDGPRVLHAKDVLDSLRCRKKVCSSSDVPLPALYVDVYSPDLASSVEMTAAKFHAMKQELRRSFGRSWSRCNVVNFGDMEYEHEAVLELGMRHEARIKSFLLPEAPQITELALRLDLLRLLLPSIVALEGDVSVDLKERPSMALLAEALSIPDLEHIEIPHAFGLGLPPSEDEVAEGLQEVAVALAF